MIYELYDFGQVELIDYTSLDEQSSADVLEMRNHPDIRKWMHDSQIIQLSQHQSFIHELAKNKSKRYFAMRSNKAIIGTLNYVDIDHEQSSCSFGLYANPKLLKPGMGSALIEVGTRYAKEVLGLTTLNLHALNDNHRAIKLYEKCGFSRNGEGQVKGDPVTFFIKNL